MTAERNAHGRPFSVAARALVLATTVAGGLLATGGEAEVTERIKSYCAASWRNARVAQQDWDDCTQQVFVEMLNRVSRDRWPTAIQNAQSPERRELNRSIWCVAQRWRRLPRFGPLEPGGVTDRTVGADSSTEPTLGDVREAIVDGRLGLSPRQQKIVTAWLDGYSVAEISEDLDLAPARVSDEKYRALKKIRHRLGDAVS